MNHVKNFQTNAETETKTVTNNNNNNNNNNDKDTKDLNKHEGMEEVSSTDTDAETTISDEQEEKGVEPKTGGKEKETNQG